MFPGRDTRHDSIGWLYLALAFSMVGIVFGLAMVSRMLGPASIPIWGGTMVALIFLANSPVGKAIGRRIAGDPMESSQRLDVPDEVYAELDELRARMVEMEERQDFSERLLAGRDGMTPDSGERATE
jgi:hypothetical protein